MCLFIAYYVKLALNNGYPRVEARAGLEQLCSYVTRPPLAAGSLEKVADDKYLFKLKSSWSDGTKSSTVIAVDTSGISTSFWAKISALFRSGASTLISHGELCPSASNSSKVCTDSVEGSRTLNGFPSNSIAGRNQIAIAANPRAPILTVRG